jgi:lysyl-tRNA synthetase class 2
LEDDLRRQREENLAALIALGLPALPNRFDATRSSAEITAAYEALAGARVRVAGRLMRVRVMGKASFAHIQDTAGQIQIYCKLDELRETKYRYFRLLDVGDLVGVDGTVFKTRTGEVTVQANEIVLLAKAYLPLPDKWHGITDVEARYRQRYLDLIANPEARRVALVRSRVVRELRRYLDERGFIEVETPILQPLYGGAAANPFVTRYAALDMDAYLRIATELYLKRLIVGGLERVYEIGKDFRNEGFSRKHSPEFTMLELYQAYADYRDIMALTEEMFAAVARAAMGTACVEYLEHEVDLTPPWRRLSIQDALHEFGGVWVTAETTREDLLTLAGERGIEVDPAASRGKVVEELVGGLVEPKLIQPTFLCDFPIDFPGSLLAKRSRENPEVVERFELYIGGMEIANAFTELNDPVDQERRMAEAAADRQGEEHAVVDRDFILALEHGMPPTGGMGFGLERLVMILTNAHHIRETILFPLLRPRGDAQGSN